MFNCNSCSKRIKKIKYYCIQCKGCSGCCSCELFGFVEHKIKFHNSKDKKVNTSNRFVAAEIEIAGLKNFVVDGKPSLLDKAEDKWKYNSVHDGSLPYCGFEITTAPANGDSFIQQITEITNGLKEHSPIITKNCGLHVHIDARDYNFHDIAKLIKVYAAIEPILFSMVPASRRKSKFCLPCGKTYKNALENNSSNYWTTKTQVVLNTYNNYDSNTHRKSKYNNARYNALNLHSWFYRGTIEFRLMEGTINPQYIINWGILWAKILDYVLGATNADIDKIVGMCGNTGATSSSMITKMINDKSLEKFILNQIKKNYIRPLQKAKKKKG